MTKNQEMIPGKLYKISNTGKNVIFYHINNKSMRSDLSLRDGVIMFLYYKDDDVGPGHLRAYYMIDEKIYFNHMFGENLYDSWYTRIE